MLFNLTDKDNDRYLRVYSIIFSDINNILINRRKYKHLKLANDIIEKFHQRKHLHITLLNCNNMYTLSNLPVDLKSLAVIACNIDQIIKTFTQQ